MSDENSGLRQISRCYQRVIRGNTAGRPSPRSQSRLCGLSESLARASRSCAYASVRGLKTEGSGHPVDSHRMYLESIGIQTETNGSKKLLGFGLGSGLGSGSGADSKSVKVEQG